LACDVQACDGVAISFTVVELPFQLDFIEWMKAGSPGEDEEGEFDNVDVGNTNLTRPRP
jgi:hypothetical protein